MAFGAPTSNVGQPVVALPTPTSNPFPLGTTLGEAVANVATQAGNDVARMNANAVAIYNVAYANYVQNMQSGQNVPPERQQPPIPPFKWEVSPPDQYGFVGIQQSTTERVCAQGPAVAMNAANPVPGHGNAPPAPGQDPVFHLGAPDTGNPGWFAAGEDDTEPSGFTKSFPGPDGKMMTVMKIKTPFHALYEQIP